MGFSGMAATAAQRCRLNERNEERSEGPNLCSEWGLSNSVGWSFRVFFPAGAQPGRPPVGAFGARFTVVSGIMPGHDVLAAAGGGRFG